MKVNTVFLVLSPPCLFKLQVENDALKEWSKMKLWQQISIARWRKWPGYSCVWYALTERRRWVWKENTFHLHDSTELHTSKEGLGKGRRGERTYWRINCCHGHKRISRRLFREHKSGVGLNTIWRLRKCGKRQEKDFTEINYRWWWKRNYFQDLPLDMYYFLYLSCEFCVVVCIIISIFHRKKQNFSKLKGGIKEVNRVESASDLSASTGIALNHYTVSWHKEKLPVRMFTIKTQYTEAAHIISENSFTQSSWGTK